jgi:MFS family permease
MKNNGPAIDLTEPVPPVLKNRGFFHLWLAQIISQSAQNAILYSLIIIVRDLSGSTTTTSGVVLLYVIPVVVFGIFSGVLVDRWSKRRLLILTNLGRAACAIAFFFGRDHVLALYGITVVFASFSQLFTTSNAASIPFMVSRQQLISANTLFSGAFTLAQILGLIILSPVILKTAGPGALFLSACAAFLVASFLTRLLPYIGAEGDQERDRRFPGREELRGALTDFGDAMRSLRADSVSALAMAHVATSSTLVLLFAVLVPTYMEEVIEVASKDAVVVFAPVAFGALLGLRAVPLMVNRYGKVRAVALGLFGLAGCLVALGMVETIASGLERTDAFNPFGPDWSERVFGLSILVTLTMLFSGPMGVAYAMLNTPAQTILHERTPMEMRGRIIASQMVLANGVALFPLVVVGGIADLYGVSRVILGIGALLAIGAAISLMLEQRWLRGEGGQLPPAGDSGHPSRATPPDMVSGSIDTA